MASINDFKANLIGGGARANQFRVTITPPPGIAIGLDVRRTSFMCKGTNNALERWSNGINDLALNTGVIDPADYQTDLTVEQLDRDDTILKTYIFRSAWPVSITAIELTSEAADALEEFECTWRYQHFEASGVNF